MNIKTFFIILFVGIISGVLSFYSDVDMLNNLYAGVVFGLCSLVLFMFLGYKTVLWKSLFYLLMSSIGYVAAVLVSMVISPIFVIPGLLGAFILCVGLSFAFKKLSSKEYIFVSLAGGVLGTLLNLFSALISDDDIVFVLFLVVWQTLMLLIISRFISKQKEVIVSGSVN